MRTVSWKRYGSPDVLRLEAVEKPTPQHDEILIKVYAATVTAGDCEVRSLKMPLWLVIALRLALGVFRPRRSVLGQEFAGEVEAVGENVTQFKPGDAVFGSNGFVFTAYADYVCFALDSDVTLAMMPTNLSYSEAATIPVGGMEALHFLRLAQIKPGETVLINGAGGTIGTFAVQLAHHFGGEVTAVDSASKFDILRDIGANHVIDYTREDFSKGDTTYDVIFDVVGTHSFVKKMRALKPGGRYLAVNLRLIPMLWAWWATRNSDKKLIIGVSSQKPEHLDYLKELIEAETIKTVIDRQYPLEQIVEAHRYVETGQKTGHVVITMGHDR